MMMAPAMPMHFRRWGRDILHRLRGAGIDEGYGLRTLDGHSTHEHSCDGSETEHLDLRGLHVVLLRSPSVTQCV